MLFETSLFFLSGGCESAGDTFLYSSLFRFVNSRKASRSVNYSFRLKYDPWFPITSYVRPIFPRLQLSSHDDMAKYRFIISAPAFGVGLPPYVGKYLIPFSEVHITIGGARLDILVDCCL